MKLENKYLAELTGTGLIVLVMYNAATAMMGGMLSKADLGVGAVAFFLAYCLFYKSSGGHFNPAVSASYWISGKMEQDEAIEIMKHQGIGAVLGLIIAYVFQLGATDFEMWDLPKNNLSVDSGYLGVVLATGLATATLSWVYMAIDNNKNEWVNLFRGVIITVFVGATLAGGSGTNPALLLIEFLTSLTTDFVPAIVGLLVYLVGCGLGAYVAGKIWNRIFG